MAIDHLSLSDGSLSADLIAQQSFATARRGFDPDEVRVFLGKVAAQLLSMHERQADLEAALRDAEHRAEHPTLDEETILSLVGEETSHILRSAHEAAADIKSRAEENASRILKEAHAQADVLRSQAETVLARRTEEAESVAARIREAAREEGERLGDQARQQAKAVRAEAESERKATIEGAQATRDRILKELSRKRNLAVVQVEQLRAGRERLMQSYQLVRRTLEEVTAELAKAETEARAAADAVRHRHIAIDEPDGIEDLVEGSCLTGSGVAKHPSGASVASAGKPGASPGKPGGSAPHEQPAPAAPGADSGPGSAVAVPNGDGTEPPAAGDAPPPGAGSEPSRRSPPAPPPPSSAAGEIVSSDTTGAQSPARPAGVEARAHLDGSQSADHDPPAAGHDLGSGEPADQPVPKAALLHVRAAPADDEDKPSVETLFARIRADRNRAVAHARDVLGQSDTTADTPVPDDDEALLQRRDEMVGTIDAGLARRLKRALQDDQNDLLDRLRGLRCPPKAALVLPERSEHAARFAAASRPFLGEGVAAGATFVASLLPDVKRRQEAREPDALVETLANAIVDPLRRRLEAVLAAGEGDETVALAEAVGGAYREWKTQRIEAVASDHVAIAFARGAFAVTPPATRLRWLVEDTDGPCPDCDDNVLAGELPKGEPFPTGQRHPPVHAGCRCLLVPELT